ARSRNSDVAGAIEQRCLQSQTWRRSPHALSLYSLRQTGSREECAVYTQRDSKCAPAHVQAGVRNFEGTTCRPVGRTTASYLGARLGAAEEALRAWRPGPRFSRDKSLGR